MVRNLTILSDYSRFGRLRVNNLIAAVSYEERGFRSLERANHTFNIQRVILLRYDVERYLEPQTLEIWQQEYSKTISYLDSISLSYAIVNCSHDDFGNVFNEVKNAAINNLESPDIVDITTLPKNYILKAAKEFDSEDNLFLYTRGEIHRVPNEEEQTISIDRIIPIDGFEGTINAENETLLVLILGFEGNRAFAFLSDFPSEQILALVGVPKLGNQIDQEYLKHAKRSNIYLLNNSAVTTRVVDSYSHLQFCQDLELAINNKGKERFNICVAPIGTKAQTLGLYLYWKKHQETQILYPVPSRRQYLAVGTGDTWVYTI